MLSISLALALAASPAPAARPRVLVYDFRNDGADEKTLRLIRETLTTELAALDRVDVVSVDEMNRLLSLEGDKEAAGCDPQGEACRAEVARSLGVRYVVFGNVGKLGAVTLINVTLLDSNNAATLVRRQIQVRSDDEIPGDLRVVADDVVNALAGTNSPGPGVWAAVAVGGAGAVVGIAGVAVGLGENGVVTTRDPVVKFAAKSDAQGARNVAYAVAAGGMLVAVGAVAVALVLE